MNYKVSLALLCAFAMSYFHPLAAQKKHSGLIRGAVVEASTNAPLPYVTVTVKQSGSDEILTGQISDENGAFTLKDLSLGKVLLEFQFIGFKQEIREVTVDQEVIDLGTILLSEDVAVLDGVEIVAERTTIEQRVDRKVINIGKDLATAGATTADLMVNIPSISMDQNGRISLRGNENVRILVDGKPTNLDADQLLQQIPPSSIKSIELITNPSAKFIPDGMSGIINIVMKKNVAGGLNGSISTNFTQGQEFRFAGSANANYKTKKLNFFVNYGNNLGLVPTFGTIIRPNDPSNENWVAARDPFSHLIKTGVDYSISDRTVFSAYTIQNRFDQVIDRFTSIDFPENATSNLSQGYVSDVANRNATWNVDLKHDFSGGQNIEFEIDHNEFSSTDDAIFTFGGQAAEVTAGAFEIIGIDRTNTTVNLDYVNTLSKNKKLELGLEARIQETRNDYETDNPDFKNALYDFDRDIYSFYASYRNRLGKWTYQVGARLEGFEMVGLLREEGQEAQRFNSPIFSVYPSAFLTYSPDPKNQRDVFNISMSRRVDRPNLAQLTPIRVWSSPRVTNIGNPELIPQFTNSLEVNYTRQLSQGSITTGLFARQISDEITRFGFTAPNNSENVFFSYSNYRNNAAFGFELSGSYKPTAFWSFSGSFDLYWQNQRGLIEDQLQEVENILYNLRMNHSFKASKKLTFQLIGLYRGPNTNLQYKTRAFYFVNVGGRYSLFGGNGTLSISFNDIFKTQQFSFDGYVPVVQIGSFDWDSRTVFIGYTHRFGNGKNQALKRKKRDRNEAKSIGF